MIRVVLAEDEALVREGIASLLKLIDDIDVVAQAVDGAEALHKIDEFKPDVVLLDIRMPGLSGLDVLTQLGARPSPPATILLTTFDDDELFLRGIRAGARGFLLKDISVDRLAEAIRVVAAGGTMIRPAVNEHVLRAFTQAGAPSVEAAYPAEALSKREVEVLRMMTGGFSNREIAEAFHTSEGTVKNQVSSILSKLGVRDRTRAVLKGFELKYL
ncbi:MAG: response regulator transcription factor [Bryobacteraceae bacterium]|nr:response regulator transcription factor [Bryobacteraceae bacterium]